jgi:hypothetical protein
VRRRGVCPSVIHVYNVGLYMSICYVMTVASVAVQTRATYFGDNSCFHLLNKLIACLVENISTLHLLQFRNKIYS